AAIDTVTAGDVTVDASASGVLAPTAIAGSVSGKNTYDRDARWNTDILGNVLSSNVAPGGLGIGASGAVAIADVDDAVTATVNHGGTMGSVAAATFTVSAANTSIVLANTGSVTLRAASANDKVSAGISGAVSLILADSNVTASLRRATVEGFAVDVSARNSRSIGGVSASGSGGSAGGSGSTTVNFAGSVAITVLATRTIATLDRVTGRNPAGVRVEASTEDLVWTVAGSFVGNVSSMLVTRKNPFGGTLPTGTDTGRSLAVGASVAILTASAETGATVVSSSLTKIKGALDVLATERSTMITASAGGSVVATGGSATIGTSYGKSAGSTVAGFVAVANVSPTVEASVSGSTVTIAEDGADVSVAATTALLLVTVSGGFVLNRDGKGTLSTSIGAAVTVVNSKADSKARIDRSTVTVPRGKVRVQGTAGNPSADEWSALDPLFDELDMPEAGSGAVWSFAVGAMASDSTFTAAASVNVTTCAVDVTAEIGGDSAVTAADGSVSVLAVDEAKVRTVAGSVSTTALTSDRSSLSAGAAILVTTLRGRTTASIASSQVTAGGTGAGAGTVAVAAAGKADILTIAASGVVAGENALSTALVFNDLTGRSIGAAITGTPDDLAGVTASRGVTVRAGDETGVLAIAGQIAIPASSSATAAAGAAGVVNAVAADVEATIADADVESVGGDVTVEAVTGGTLRAWAVGVSGALSNSSGSSIVGKLPVSFVGAGSFALNTVVRRAMATVGDGAEVTARSLSVTARDSGGIFAVAGALAAQAADKTVSVACGISVAVNE
ncbi:MAG: hypothetical protein EBU70_09185, partial [Actinobacteria bacterium]|nr:hypothetical protein [Actinomycetota bacterium]